MSKHLLIRSNLTIQTKYAGPTNTLPSRIVATDSNKGRIVVSWDHGLDSRENHEAAASALCAKFGRDVTLLKCEALIEGCLFIAVPFGLLP